MTPRTRCGMPRNGSATLKSDVVRLRRDWATLLTGMAIVAAAVQIISAQQAPTFSSRVEAVRVDALVTDHGKPVRGLKAEDFVVTDNGVAQQVDVAAFDAIPLNVVLALDVSGSMVGEPLAELQDAGRAVVEGLAKDDRSALVTFSHVVSVRQPLTADRAAVLAALGSETSGGETALVDAAYAAMALGEADVGRALVILFSDGVDTTSWLAPAAVLRSARRTDAVVYAVSSPGAGKTPKFLDDLCETTGGRLLEVSSTERLRPVLLQILQEFRERYVFSYTPRGVSRDGWHALQVKVKGRSVSVKARPGYLCLGSSNPPNTPSTMPSMALTSSSRSAWNWPSRRFRGNEPLFCLTNITRSSATLSGISTTAMMRRMASSWRRR